MATLLKIDVSPRGDASYSRQFGSTFLNAWQAANPGATVTTRDLAKQQPTYVDLQWIAGAFTPPEQLTDEHKGALKLSNEIVAEVQAADTILITTPMYNFQVPAVLKAWIDHLVRVGVTVNYTAEGPVGQLKGKKVVVIVAGAGSYDKGTPTESYDFLSPYVRHVLGFIGLTNVEILIAGGAAGVQYGKITEAEWKKPFDEKAAALATA
jgi:FMN-dependent NADH-azoreductase